MKVSKCKINGKDGYVCSYRRDGKYCRKYFYSRKDADAFKRSLEDVEVPARSKLLSLPEAQVDDIIAALKILPAGKSLYESVLVAWQYYSSADFHSLADQFLAIKKNKFEAGLLDKSEFVHIKGRIANLKATFKSFDAVDSVAVRDYLRSKGASKTVKNWRATLSEFFKFCISKKAVQFNPVDAIHGDELIIPDGGSREIGFLPVETAKNFMAFIEESYPQYARFYALAMFAGIRVAEAPRLKDEYFRYEDRKIIFPAQIGKIKKSWTLEDLPDNLWAWLEKYKDFPIVKPSDFVRSRTFAKWNLPQNFARHSFATYHLSLYLDPRRTSMITRNSEQMLRDHYWAALVDKETAKAYFEISPK